VNRSPTLLVFDFDGTLAPICDDPAAVRMHRAASTLLNETAELSGVAVAVASGRDVDDLAARTNAPGAYLVGSHGLEIRGPGGTVVRDSPPLDAAVAADLRQEIESAGLRLERKKHGIALHWRGVSSDRIVALAGRFRAWGEENGLAIIEGRCVIEARCRGGGKEEAVRWLATATGASRVIYAGDDLTDFGALRFAAAHGRGVFVASSERPAPEGVTVVQSLRELVQLIRREVLV
jgi:trehalose 6-phosphate phosphatase